MANVNSVGLVNGFLVKLWKLLENSCDNSIVWSEDGRSFIISDPYSFSQSLPKYFKHSKLPSFIRQLNMYGFRKVTSNMNWAAGDGIKVEDDLHFYHPNFRRGEEDQLALIRRKMPCKVISTATTTLASASSTTVPANQMFMSSYMSNHNGKADNVTQGLTFYDHPSTTTDSEQSMPKQQRTSPTNGGNNFDMLELKAALDEARACTAKQTETTKVIMELKQENQVLWRELLELRQKYNNQQDVIGALIKFLFKSIQGRYATPSVAKNRKIPSKLMIGDHENANQTCPPEEIPSSAYPSASLSSYSRHFAPDKQQLNVFNNNMDSYEHLQMVNNNLQASPVSLVESSTVNGSPSGPPGSPNHQIAYDIANWFQEQLSTDAREPCIDEFMELFEGQIPED